MKDDAEEISHDSPLEKTIQQASEALMEHPQQDSAGKVEEKKPLSAQYVQWLQQCDKEQMIENKIRLAIDFMRSCLSEGETPRFKDFWECRRQCVLFFKENITAKSRAQFWKEYVELSNEARRLKELLDEQAAFAIEQIELAILSIEGDLEHFIILLQHVPDIAFPQENVSLKDKQASYNSIQKELQLLNTLAIRINSMRKEIIKTEMRIRIKNKLLDRLSTCGDRVFPKRKELIKTLSKEFIADVEQFVQTYFQTEEIKALPLHVLREEIKFLQSLAKILTLNTQAFTATRQALSECWDKVRSQEKERKKVIYEKKATYRQNFDLVLEKVSAFAQECQGEMSLTACNERSQEIFDYMKSVELGRDEVKVCRDELAKAKKIVLLREQEKEQQRVTKERDLEIKRREKINAFKEELQHLIQDCDQYETDPLLAKRDELIKAFEQMGLNKIEKQMIDRLFKQLKDAIAEKKEKAVLSLSEDDLKSLEQLKILLKERRDRRSEIKTQLEHYRKALGGSGFDFEKAILYRELIESEKSSLEKIESAIEELEQKIEDIEG